MHRRKPREFKPLHLEEKMTEEEICPTCDQSPNGPIFNMEYINQICLAWYPSSHNILLKFLMKMSTNQLNIDISDAMVIP